MQERTLRILAILGDEEARKTVKQQASTLGRVDFTSTVDEALEVVKNARAPYHVCLIRESANGDQLRPRIDAISTIRRIASASPSTEFIVISKSRTHVVDALRAGAYRFVSEPFDPDELGFLIQQAYERRQFKVVNRMGEVLEQLRATITSSGDKERTVKDGFQVSLMVSSSLDFEHTLLAACRSAKELLNVSHSGLVLFDAEQTRGTVRAEFPSLGIQGLEIPLKGVPAEEELLSTKEPLIIQDVQSATKLGPVRDILNNLRIRSILFVPVFSKDRLLGSFSLDMIDETRSFSESEIELCKVFASLVGVAIENAQLYEETRRRAEQLELLRRLTLEVSSETEPSTLLNKIVAGAVTLLKAKAGGVYEFDEKRNELSVISDPSRPELVGTVLKASEGLAGFLIREKDPFGIVDDYAQWPHRAAIFEEKAWFGSVLEVPLTLREKVIGILYVDDVVGRKFTVEDAWLLGLFANTAAIVLKNTQLLEEGRNARESLKALYGASNMLVASDDPGSVLRDIVGHACSAAKGDAWVSIIVIDEKERPTELITSESHESFDVSTVIRPDGLSVQVMRDGKPVWFEDASKEASRVNPIVKKDGICAALCLPLAVRGKRIGVMWIHYSRPHRFPEFEIESWHLFANQAAIAFDSAKRLAELQHLRRAADALAGAATLRESLQQVVNSAKEVLRSDSAFIWPYSSANDRFVSDNSVNAGIPEMEWEDYRNHTPRPGGTSYRVMEENVLTVESVDKIPGEPSIGESTKRFLQKIGAKSFLALALKTGDEKLGVLYINFNRERQFSADEQETACTFASHAALALKKARLMEAVSRAKQAAEIVAEVMLLGDREATLTSITKAISETVECDAVVLYVYSQSEDRFDYPPVMLGVRNCQKVLDTKTISQKSIVSKVLNLDEPYYAEDTSKDSLFEGSRFSREEEISSCIATPLSTPQQKVGVMFVNYRRPQRFDVERINTVKLFANQAAVALTNTQLFESLGTLSEDLLSTSDRHETLNRTVAFAAHLLGTDCCNVVLPDAHGDLVFAAECGWKEVIINETKISKGQGSQTGYTVLTGKPVVVDDFQKETRFEVPEIVRTNELTSSISVPMFREGQIVGAMLVHSKAQRHFSHSEVTLLSLVANQTAIAVESAEQYEAIKRKRDHLDALYEAGKAITAASSGLERKQILDQIIEQAVKCYASNHKLEAAFGTIWLYEVENDDLIFESAYSIQDFAALSAREGSRRSLSQAASKIGVTGRAVRLKEIQVVQNVKDDRDYIEFDSRTQSEVVLPLLDHGRVIGVISIESRAFHGFDSEDIALLSALGELAVITITNALQHEQLKKTQGLVGSRTALAWMGMTSSIWWHAVTGHAQTIKDKVQYLRLILPRGSSDEVLDDLAAIEDIANRIQEKAKVSPLSGDEGVESVYVNAIIAERIKQLWESEGYDEVACEFKLGVDESITVKVSPDWLKRAFDRVVENAVEAMRDAQNKQLTISTRLTAGSVEIEIADLGDGISPDVLPQLFQNQIKKPKGTKGLGMGLLMAQCILQTYGGEIEVADTGTSGTSILIRLPAEIY